MTSALPPAEGLTSATSAAEATIRNLSNRYPGKVQIHLHPSSSLPSTIVDEVSPTSSSSTSTSDSLLPVALVWTVESLKLLRGYGLTGSFTGTLAQFPQQNIFLGLPIQLLPEEVVFLLRRGKAVVVEESVSYRPGTAEEVAKVDEATQADRKSQQLEAWHERQLLKAKHASQKPNPQAGVSPIYNTAAVVVATPPPTNEELTPLPWHYTIPTQSTSLPWYTPITYTTLSTIQTIYPYPSTEKEVASVGLFEHFLSAPQNMWCMSGLRFGGAFAVYPGDPLRYHSHYTAQLVLEEEDIALTSLVANGRLGTAVKKTHLLCHVEKFDPEVKKEIVGLKVDDDGRRTALECIKMGRFDVAPLENGAADSLETKTGIDGERGEREDEEERREAGRKFAEFNIFSLAWAGFGT